jgi:hypothetical protein
MEYLYCAETKFVTSYASAPLAKVFDLLIFEKIYYQPDLATA